MPSLGLVIVPLSLFGISQELCSFSVTTLYITKEPQASYCYAVGRVVFPPSLNIYHTLVYFYI
jgi:hypothetical protein